MFCIFDVKYGLDKSYFKVLSWWEVASFDFMRFIFEVGGVLERVISAVCILGNSIPTLRVAEEAPGLRAASRAEQSCCWSHAAASTPGLGLAQGCWLLPFQLMLSLGLELFLTAGPGSCGRKGGHAKEPGASRDPALLPAQLLLTLPSPTCTRSRCHNLLLILLCSVAAPHSSHGLKSHFQLPKLSRSQSSCFAQGWELNLSLFCLRAAAVPAAQTLKEQGVHVFQGSEVWLNLRCDAS